MSCFTGFADFCKAGADSGDHRCQLLDFLLQERLASCCELSLADSHRRVRASEKRESNITQIAPKRGFRATDRLHLARNPLLDGLPEDVISATLEHGLRRHVDARTTVIEYGTFSQELLFLLSGAFSDSQNHPGWQTDRSGDYSVVQSLNPPRAAKRRLVTLCDRTACHINIFHLNRAISRDIGEKAVFQVLRLARKRTGQSFKCAPHDGTRRSSK